jgi:hypothetical protein
LGSPCMLLVSPPNSHGSVVEECAFYRSDMLGSLFLELERTTIRVPDVGGCVPGIGVDG